MNKITKTTTTTTTTIKNNTQSYNGATKSFIDASNNAIRTQQSIRQLHYGNTIVVFLFDLKLLLLK